LTGAISLLFRNYRHKFLIKAFFVFLPKRKNYLFFFFAAGFFFATAFFFGAAFFLVAIFFIFLFLKFL